MTSKTWVLTPLAISWRAPTAHFAFNVHSTVKRLAQLDSNFVRAFQESTFFRSVLEDFLQTMVNESLKVPAHVWRSTLQGLLEDNSSAKLAKVKAPTLIIWGDQDTIVSMSDQKKMTAGIEGSQLKVYPGVGHAIHWEEPDNVASDIILFIKEYVV